MSLGERLNDLRGVRTLIRRPRLPTSSKVESAYDRVCQKYDRITIVEKVDYESLLAKLQLVARLRTVALLSQREMRLAASCLFEGENKIADDPDLLVQYLGALRPLRSRVAIKRLIHSYCLHFDHRHPGIRLVAMFLRDAVHDVDPGPRWAWPERHQRFGLFNPLQVPARLAKLTIDAPNPREQLEFVGLSGQLMAGGLAANVFLSALRVIQARLSRTPNSKDVDRLVNWVRRDDGGMYYSAYRGAIANALLLPWIAKVPDQDIRQGVQSFLLDKLSDPRISGGAWVGVDESARDVMIRWLAHATLEQFLNVVDRVAAKHQWEYRRAFWKAYIEKGAVANAWVAFGSSGAQVARKLAESSGDTLMCRFGTLSGAGADQAVLLLSIGDLIVADWSHNGRLRIWRRGNQSAPVFNQEAYAAFSLRQDSEFDTVHLPPDGWQSSAEAYIRRNTGIRLDVREYMPRRDGT